MFVAASVLTVWWDVYHSSLQTFGLGRIYDRRAGNDVDARAALARQPELRTVLVPLGLTFLVGYLFGYQRLARTGYVVPVPKLVLYSVTAFVSITCWGFGSFAEAFLVMNAFHALQYFAIVWWSEKRTIMDFFSCPRYLALGILLASGLGYGYLRAGTPEDYVPFIALSNVVSLMHFWYDGFVWSVRKGDV